MVTEAARAATPADLDHLVELVNQSRTELAPTRGGELWELRDAEPPPHRPRLASQLSGEGAGAVGVLCGTIDDVVVGLAVVTVEVLRDGRPIAVLQELYVEPEGRGVGVGEALMRAVLAWAGERECVGINGAVLPGNRTAKNFFERFGLTARAITVYRRLP